MSGICGIYSPGRLELASESSLGRMLTAIEHRGRTKQTFIDPAAGLCLGYTYLPAFLAPGEAPTPSWFEGEDCVAAVDGSLSLAMPPPVSTNPEAGERHTGLLIQRYASDPVNFIGDLRGNFVAALWDRSKRQLSLMSDPNGSKLLYYYSDESRGLLVFASELKAIYEHPAVRIEPDLVALRTILAVSYAPAPLSILKGGRKLGPGEVVRMGVDGQPDVSAYGDLKRPPLRDDLPSDQAVALFREKFRKAVERVTQRSPRLAVFHSGGKDSTLLLAGLKEALDSELLSICLGFPEANNQDLYWAARTAEELGVRHRSIRLQSAVVPIDLIAAIVQRFDEPGNTFAAVADYFLTQAAAGEGFNSCLTGDQVETMLDAWSWPKFLATHPGREAAAEAAISAILKHTPNIDYDDQSKLIVEERFPAGYDESLEQYIGYYRERIPTINPFDFCTTLANLRGHARLLSKHLQAGTAGIEYRAGLADADLLAFMRSVPQMRLENAGTRSLLGRAYGHLVPSLWERTQKGGLPGFPWGRPGYEHIENAILTAVRRLPETGLFQARYIERLIEKYRMRERKEATMMKLHLLFDVQCWFDNYVYRRDPFRALP
jgi:asparagine synthase (glutamine-hydrolysing)